MSQKDVDKQSHQLKINLRTPPPFPPPSCPRCSSSNTKFCYYNNYSESQPRYFCKNCRRYWTHGGVVRTLPSTRKRGRTVFSSLNSQISKPPPSAPLVPPPLPAARKIGGTRSSVGCLTLGAPITDTTQSFGGGGLFSQTPFMISQGSELGNVNAAFGVVNARGFGVRAPLLPTAPLTPLLTNLSPLDDFRDFGFPLLQQPQFQPPPPPPELPTVWTSQNMACNSTSPNNFLPITRDLTAAANVVNINEWPEFNDMDTYKTASP